MPAFFSPMIVIKSPIPGVIAILIASGIARNNIYEIAFAFDGKEVLVKERHVTASDDGV